MNITTSKLTRAAGLCAMLAGLIYIIRQPLHPLFDVSAVNGSNWAIMGYLTLGMSVLGLAGVTGIYLRQVKETGLLGLIGYLLFGSWFVLLTAVIFAQTLIMPPLAAESPQFVNSFLVIFGGSGGTGGNVDLGVLGTMGPVSFVLYVLGGLLLGIAIFRAGILSRWAAALLVVGMVLTPLASVFPQTRGSIFAVPVGLALVWLGYSLWSEQRRNAARPATGMQSPKLNQTLAV
ncbi:hypothetical protein [Arthrobacter sp. VKM Ac-2550]|uniref:hypothetical protein n=1 Tax=Crystallibacter permensis TaxID=1938888 RepID=UPI0022272BB6|nr:hypothetical protein [Arthrobacter sp. VKM Ac-2550]MCW2135197.1 hypothetical protein [Arthrobacter sp. VKM Ac-2550]